MNRLIVVSNRVPCQNSHQPLAGGLTRGLEDALRQSESVWFGWSGELEDNTDVLNLQRKGNITFATVPLCRKDYDQYYCGFANSLLWPTFHYRIDLARYDSQHYATYRQVNERFARKLRSLLKPDDLIWVHDYHFIPFARCCRKLGIENRIGFFLHIPFPVAEIFGTIPCGDELMSDLAEYDILGFHTDAYREAFLNAQKRFTPNLQGKCRTGVYPIGVCVEDIRALAEAAAPDFEPARQPLFSDQVSTIISVDRLDYTKGLTERFDAYERFLEKYPEHQHSVQMLQIAPNSRSEIPSYQTLRQQLECKAGHINGRYADLTWQPLHYINRAYDRQMLMGIYQRARVGFVTPLRDGMNLVAKEYVAAQRHYDPGVLVLSQFAGAAYELKAAVQVNPHDREAVADALHYALTMPLMERMARHIELMRAVRASDIDIWSKGFMEELRGPSRPRASSPDYRRAGSYF